MHVAGVDEPFREQEADRELEVSSGGAHRDGDGLRLLPRTPRPDLHRLFRGERVGPLRPLTPTDRHDPGGREVPAEGFGDGHP